MPDEFFTNCLRGPTRTARITKPAPAGTPAQRTHPVPSTDPLIVSYTIQTADSARRDMRVTVAGRVGLLAVFVAALLARPDVKALWRLFFWSADAD